MTLYLICNLASQGEYMMEQQKEQLSFNLDDPNFDRKFDLATEGARRFVKEHLLTRILRKS